MKQLIIVLAFLFLFPVLAQDKKSKKFAKTITAEDLRTHLSVLASDEYEGRETGKKGQKMAAEYLAKEYKKMGLQPGAENSFLQEFQVVESEVRTAYFLRENDKKSSNEDFLYYSKSETRGEEYINLIMSDENDSMLSSYAGAYVVYAAEKLGGLSDRIEKAKEAGAVGYVIIITNDTEFSSTMGRFVPYLKTPSMGLEERKNDSDIMIIVDKKMSSWLFKKPFDDIKAGEKSEVIFNADYLDRTLPVENVAAFLKGSQHPEELLVVTSHYDHIGIIDGKINNGADDDGSGTATVLEIAQAFMKATNNGKRPKRSILFMNVAGEEKGLLGSAYYTDHAPLYSLENTVANLNIDMVGRIDEKHKDNPDYIYLIGSDKLSQELHDLSESTNKAFTQLELDYEYNDENDPNRFYYRSDHYNFAKNNIPVIFYFNGTHEDYHQPTDTIEKIDFEQMSKRAKLIFHTAWEIANREKKIKLN